MKTLAKTFSAVLLLTLPVAAFAQLAVAVVGDVPSTINQAQTMVQWANQYRQMVGQIEQMKMQYQSMTGNRGLGQISNAPSLRNYLPDQWASVYDKVRSGQLAGISGKAASITSDEGFDPAAIGGKKRQQEVLAANKAMTMQAYEATQARLNNINSLMQKADETQDAKAAADLQNRIGSENAMIQNEQIRLNLMAQLQQAELLLAKDQQVREFEAKYFK